MVELGVVVARGIPEDLQLRASSSQEFSLQQFRGCCSEGPVHRSVRENTPASLSGKGDSSYSTLNVHHTPVPCQACADPEQWIGRQCVFLPLKKGSCKYSLEELNLWPG